MAEATITRIRTATPKRWQSALKRAFDSGITLYQIAGTGEAVVTSQREPGTVYRTDGTICDCAAHMLSGDPVCAHRALFLYNQGLLELESTPEPEPPASARSVDRLRFGLEQGGNWIADLTARQLRGEAIDIDLIREAYREVGKYAEAVARATAATPRHVASFDAARAA